VIFVAGVRIAETPQRRRMVTWLSTR